VGCEAYAISHTKDTAPGEEDSEAVSYDRPLYCCAVRSYALFEAVCAWFVSGSMPTYHRFKSRAATSVLPLPAPGVKALTGRGSVLP
jgi:hypothetical protein